MKGWEGRPKNVRCRVGRATWACSRVGEALAGPRVWLLPAIVQVTSILPMSESLPVMSSAQVSLKLEH